MPTARLTPSTYYLSNTSYLSVSDAANMYTDTDSTTHATVTNSRTSTSNYYIYVRGFNFDAIPTTAKVGSFAVKLKGNYSGGYSQNMYLYNGTSASVGSASSLSTTVSTHEFSCSESWADLVAMGDDFGIRINCRRASRNTTSCIYIYGAEIEVSYTVPDPCTITAQLTGSGTIDPAGACVTYEGEEYTLTITPTNAADTVTVTKDGADVTAQLVAHGAGQTVNLTPDDVTTSGISSGASYAEYAVGQSAESPSSSGASSNMYASSGSTGYAEYSFDFSGIPSGAVIESLEVDCYGHRENATIDSTHVSSVGIYLNGTAISEDVDFPNTSNSTITITTEQQLTRAQLDNVTIRHYVGYYGGLVLGATCKVTYSTGSGIDHYTLTFTTTGDALILVTIGGGSVDTDKLYFKSGGAWVEVQNAYKKVNGAWVEISVSEAFAATNKYIHG